MSTTVYPPEKIACAKHVDPDCAVCFTPSDPMHGDAVDQREADLGLRIEQLEAELDSATTRGRELVDEADARADRAEREALQAERHHNEVATDLEIRATKAEAALRKCVRALAHCESPALPMPLGGHDALATAREVLGE